LVKGEYMELWNKIRSNKYLRFLPLLMGVAGGYAYYYFIGCNNGCAITSSPWTSMLYGALVGGVLIPKKVK
jgi:xanthine/uracil permease